MLGSVPRDDARNNFRTANSLTAGTVFAASNLVVTLPYQPTVANVDASYVLEPSNFKTVYRLSKKIGLTASPNNAVVTFSVSSVEANVGDEIAIQLQAVVNATPGWNARIVFAPENDPDSPWYVTSCGGVHYGYATSLSSGQRLIQHFMYDGEKWVNTIDNC